ncbi:MULTISPECIES: hypothetical protein [Pseudoalteromonas]|uniref:hypothetical protein n=1 Tax=Pseudoalteromonas TaxID=53246 RepID=UPI001583E120|nr:MULTISPECIES: hypothetical protein [Pseudoalteromonas]MDI4652079.1 hypothetical protein [Pseudoalteromonas shioyasakiensis]NUJ38404.1 hypothetical protein [Pseudoalteromonas sp. 0303]
MQNKQLLIYFILVLACIKFLLIPFFDYQDSLVQEKQNVVIKNNKMESIIEKKAILESQQTEINTALLELEKKIPSFSSEAQAKLSTQQRLEVIASNLNLSIDSFNWEEIKRNEAYPFLREGNLIVTFSADLLNIIKAQKEITDLAPFFTIESARNDLKLQKTRNMSTSRVVLSVLFRVEDI